MFKITFLNLVTGERETYVDCIAAESLSAFLDDLHDSIGSLWDDPMDCVLVERMVERVVIA